MDYVKAAWTDIGCQVDFWTVDMRPGKPCAFGRRKEKVWFGLPGNPVSALVSFLLTARPALLRLQGRAQVLPRTIPSVLSEPLANHAGRRHFMRVKLDERGCARSAGDAIFASSKRDGERGRFGGCSAANNDSCRSDGVGAVVGCSCIVTRNFRMYREFFVTILGRLQAFPPSALKQAARSCNVDYPSQARLNSSTTTTN